MLAEARGQHSALDKPLGGPTYVPRFAGADELFISPCIEPLCRILIANYNSNKRHLSMRFDE